MSCLNTWQAHRRPGYALFIDICTNMNGFLRFVRSGVLEFAAFTYNLAKGNQSDLDCPSKLRAVYHLPRQHSHSFLLRLCVSQNFHPVRKAPTTDKRSQCRRGGCVHLLSPSMMHEQRVSHKPSSAGQLFPTSANHQDYTANIPPSKHHAQRQFIKCRDRIRLASKRQDAPV